MHAYIAGNDRKYGRTTRIILPCQYQIFNCPGWDQTYYEPGMPGYLAMYHNALWASLASGSCATPFWWSYSDRVNDGIVRRAADESLHRM